MAVKVGTLPIDTDLPAGIRLLDALAALLNDEVESACVALSGGGLGPFAYVIPALSPDAEHAAFYSEVHRLPEGTRLEAATATVGYKDGQPFFHCHALWTDADGRRGCGHVLPDATFIEKPIRIVGCGIVGARFEVTPDPETGFSLFMPNPTTTRIPENAGNGLAVRLAPNQDAIETLEKIAREAGFERAGLRGGVASTIEARFSDAEPLPGFATELLVRRGIVAGAGGAGTSEIEVAIVDHHGDIREGHLVRGDNPVLMTFECVLETA